MSAASLSCGRTGSGVRARPRAAAGRVRACGWAWVRGTRRELPQGPPELRHGRPRRVHPLRLLRERRLPPPERLLQPVRELLQPRGVEERELVLGVLGHALAAEVRGQRAQLREEGAGLLADLGVVRCGALWGWRERGQRLEGSGGGGMLREGRGV